MAGSQNFQFVRVAIRICIHALGQRPLANGGPGTHTVAQRIRSPYWGGTSDYASSGGVANIYQLATFSNGSAPMGIEVPYWELHLIAGGASVSVCPKTHVRSGAALFRPDRPGANG